MGSHLGAAAPDGTDPPSVLVPPDCLATWFWAAWRHFDHYPSKGDRRGLASACHRVSMRGWPPQRGGSPTPDWEHRQAYPDEAPMGTLTAGYCYLLPLSTVDREFRLAYPDETPEGTLTPGHLHLFSILRYVLNGRTLWISPSHLAAWWNIPIMAWRPRYPCEGEPCGTGRYCGNCSLLMRWLIAAPMLDLPVRALVSAASLHGSRLLPTLGSSHLFTRSHSSAAEGGGWTGQGLPPAGGTP